MSESLEARIAAYLAHRIDGARDVAVDELARIYGGSSKETFRLRARWRLKGEEVEQRLILRREPPTGLVNAAEDLEYIVYQALDGQDVPVPRARWLELDPGWLDRPFFIMDLAPGKPGHFWLSGDPFEGQARSIGQRFWRHMGALAALDPYKRRLEALRNGTVATGFAARELDHWEAKLDEGEQVVEPIVRGALRWLRRNLPPEPRRPALVHGDFRAGNFLFTPDGVISAILDWELCHIGDPLEDIAWALDPMWSMERHFPLEDGLACWQAASGQEIDRAALDWWRLFASVKACGLWTTADASFADAKNREMIVALTAMRANHFHRKQILAQMAARL